MRTRAPRNTRSQAARTGEGMTQTEEDTIRNVMFDSRIDKTKVRYVDEETGRFYLRVENQDDKDVNDTWNEIKQTIQDAAEETCGRVTRTYRNN